MKHRLEAMNRRVVEEFDRTKQRMYKRYERAQGINRKQSEKDLTLSELYEWIDAATDARNAFLRGELSEEDALKIIAAP